MMAHACGDVAGLVGLRRRGVRILTALAVTAAVVAGCGQPGPALEEAAGSVTLDGQPIEGATVTFVPVAGTEGLCSGITDPAGRFRLTTVIAGLGALPGAAAGDYAVTVTKVIGSSAPAASQDPGYVAPTSQTAPPKVTYVVPKRYAEATTSGLTVTVGPGANEPSFALESQPGR